MYKRILTVQDISCVGQCSGAAALPVLSAWGHEVSILPTMILSTHTGGFGRPAVVRLEDQLADMSRHWLDAGIRFDAVLVGYLGSVTAAEAAGEILDSLLAPGGISIVDPAMGDHGKLYSGFDEGYVRAVKQLCGKADILLPNLTEAAMIAGMPYREIMEIDYVNQILDGFPGKTVILTGTSFEKGKTGVLISTPSARREYAHKIAGRPYGGTGDLFAACFTGALMQGWEIYDAAKTAADFVCRCIEYTEASRDPGYGVKFAPILPWLMEQKKCKERS